MGTEVFSDESEVWMPAPRLPFYAVSNLGNVQGPLKRLSPYKDADGYLRIGAKGTSFLVHRMVAEAFLGPCPEGCEVAHKDHDRANPRLDNLEYLTHAENVKGSARAGRSMAGERHVRATLSQAQVDEIRAAYRPGDGYRVIAAKYGVGWSAIRHIVKGNTWGSSPQLEHKQGGAE